MLETTTSKLRKIPAPSSETLSLSGQFEEFDEFSEFAAAWDIDFRQIGRGRLNATITQAVGPSWSIAHARFDRGSYQQGISVPGMRTFALLEPSAPEVEWCGRALTAEVVGAFSRSGEFRSIAPPGFGVTTLSFPEEELSLACERVAIHDVSKRIGDGETTLKLDPEKGTDLRQRAHRALELVGRSDRSVATSLAIDHLREEICEQLVLALAPGSPIRRNSWQRKRSLTIQRSLATIEAGLAEAISVPEIAAGAGVSRRTLENVFRERLGVSPKSFVNSQRLVLARRYLRRLSDDEPISEVANRLGFWHLGQFARDYRQLFNELPSETRRTDKASSERSPRRTVVGSVHST